MKKTADLLAALQETTEWAEFVIGELEEAERTALRTDTSDQEDLLDSFEKMKDSISCALSRLK